MPSILDVVSWKRPRVAVARYVAMGSDSRHTQVVVPVPLRVATRRPFDIAVRPAGTVTAMS